MYKSRAIKGDRARQLLSVANCPARRDNGARCPLVDGAIKVK